MSLDPNSKLTLASLQPNDLLEVYHEKKLYNVRYDNFSKNVSDRYNVKDYGTSGNGTGNDNVAILAAASAAGNDGMIYFPSGDYVITETLALSCNIDAHPNARLLCQTDGTCLEIGNSTTSLRHKYINLPQIIQQNIPLWSSGNIGDDVGVLFYAINESEIHLNRIYYFSYGVSFYGSAGLGISYNNIFVSHLDNNAINFYSYPISTGWFNQNNIYGGRFQHYSNMGTAVSGVRQIETVLTNGNTFVGCSLEGSVSDYQLSLRGAANNIFVNCRFEDSTPTIRFIGETINSTLYYSQRNMIVGGYDISNAVITQDSGGRYNSVLGPNRYHIAGATTNNALMALQNQFGANEPALVVLNSGISPFTDNLSSEWSLALAASGIKGKRETDAYSRVSINAITAGISMGAGTATPDKTISLSGDRITYNCEIELLDNGEGILMHSPDGTRYKLSVANGGTLDISSI